jgi:plasmid stabilization system protein ParE
VNWPPLHPAARREFDEAFDLLAQDSAATARRLVERTEATIRLLRQFPTAGRPLGSLNRRFPVRPFPYNLIYCLDEEDIFVVASPTSGGLQATGATGVSGTDLNRPVATDCLASLASDVGSFWAVLRSFQYVW